MKLVRLAILASLPLLSSCALLVGTADGEKATRKGQRSLQEVRATEERELAQGAKAQLDLVRRQVAAGQFAQAEATLAPLANASVYPEEVAELRTIVSAGRERETVLRSRQQIAVARRLAYKGDFDEAEAVLGTQDPVGPCREEIREIRELIATRRLKAGAKVGNRQATEIRRAIRREEFATADALLDALEGSNAAPAQVAALKLELQAARDGVGPLHRAAGQRQPGPRRSGGTPGPAQELRQDRRHLPRTRSARNAGG